MPKRLPMRVQHEFKPEVATFLEKVDEGQLETMIADALDEQDFDEDVREAFASEEGQAILKKFAEHYTKILGGSND